jgi:hypothetical protein
MWPRTSWPVGYPEGTTDLAELVRLAGELPRERLWGVVVESVDAATARSCAFTAAVLAAEQARRVSQVACQPA